MHKVSFPHYPGMVAAITLFISNITLHFFKLSKNVLVTILAIVQDDISFQLLSIIILFDTEATIQREMDSESDLKVTQFSNL